MVEGNILSAILTGTVSNILSAVLLSLAAFAIVDQTKLRPWVYKYLKPTVFNIYTKLTSWISNTYFRVAIFLFSLGMVYFSLNKEVFSIVVFFVFLTFVLKQREIIPSSPSSEFSYGFDDKKDLENWIIKTGSPSIDSEMGKPPPSLRMMFMDPPIGTNTFIVAEGVEKDRGVIECDIYLYPGSLLNIVFFCDETNENWHMARFETRGGVSDGFLIKDQGKEGGWRENKMVGTRTEPNVWHKVRVEFSSERARMFRNGELLAEITNPQILGKSIGLFNETGEVRVDNFTFSSR